MTTAFAYAVHGRLITALAIQPAGLVAAMLTAACAIASLWALAMGTPLGPLLRWLWRPTTVWLIGVLVIASWVYKSLTLYGGTSF